MPVVMVSATVWWIEEAQEVTVVVVERRDFLTRDSLEAGDAAGDALAGVGVFEDDDGGASEDILDDSLGDSLKDGLEDDDGVVCEDDFRLGEGEAGGARRAERSLKGEIEAVATRRRKRRANVGRAMEGQGVGVRGPRANPTSSNSTA
jgi:hypothetical protein